MGRMTLAARVRECGRELYPKREPPSLESVVKCITRIERGEVRRPGGDFYAPTLAMALGKSAKDLFGEEERTAQPRTASFVVTSHQIVPVFIGADAAERLMRRHDFRDRGWEWTHIASRQMVHPTGTCTAHVLEWGVVVFHISHQLTLDNVADLARWRKDAHGATFDEGTDLVRDLLGDPTAGGPEYVLSAFWVEEPMWSGTELDTAMRLMCVPSVLLDRRLNDDDDLMTKAEAAERAHLRAGFTHPDIVEFGVSGVSIGCASWSGVVYLPLAPARALRPDEFTSFEVVAQGLWCYGAHILATEDLGRLPVRYGWRFLRSCRARLTAATPLETGQVRMMRDAVLRTSRVLDQLSQAQSILRDSD